MRTLSGTTAAALAGPITRPLLLIELSLSPVQRWSTGGAVTWNGYAWSESGARVEDLSELPGAAVEGRISAPNADGALGALLLAQGATDLPCRIWALYGDGPYALGDAVLLFDGVTDGAEHGLRVTIGLITAARRRLTAPRLRCAPPLCNRLPPAGTVLAWNGERYVLEGGA
ncbi:hypothetical protein [Plasticicumulans sp.]|uniref:hypothetical protein n=1 Tax=Plasticicumulans sp. TaxID=2307179 RepID=UPI00321FB295